MRGNCVPDLTAEPKLKVCLARTRSRHPSVDGDWGFETKHACSFASIADLKRTIRPHGQSPLPRIRKEKRVRLIETV